MSHTPDKWEADIRQQVEGHVFDYDPQAWAAMEDLLGPPDTLASQAADQPTPPPPGGSGTSAASLWIGSAIVLGFAVLGWLLQPKNALAPTAISSWPIVVEEVVESPPTTHVAPAPRLREPLTLIRELPLPTTDEQLVGEDVAARYQKALRDKILLDFSRRDRGLTAPLPGRPLPERLLSTEEPGDELGQQPQLPPDRGKQKRKRDRKTLFPDVIENY